ncbi:MAG: MarR family winged helix-turn-helix transcriptional regulator [Eubacteriaceae bacterium]|jgi:MarR family transcriptional regulator for hemolysin|nr:MarR family winged helix-turn-helix transcriptional regulator [Eubacteriaceae bacterium]MDD4507349.1 MarR family winged helix-turn-helix transcriptional regulator [Eubacteriaceae bacterium]
MYNEFENLLTGQLFKKIADAQYRDIMARYHLRKVELDILNFIAKAGSRDTAKDIMDWRYLSKAHVSKSVNNLKKYGYISLTEDESDHRCFHIQITPEAKPVLEAYYLAHKHLQEILFSGITESEKSIIGGVIRKILSNMNDACHYPKDAGHDPEKSASVKGN